MAWVYERGSYRTAGAAAPRGGADADVVGINARGDVLGNRSMVGGKEETAPVVWAAGSGTPTELSGAGRRHRDRRRRQCGGHWRERAR